MCKGNFTIEHKGNTVPVWFFATFPPTAATGTSGQKLSKSFGLPETSVFSFLCNQLEAKDRNASIVLEGNTTRPSDLNRHAILHGESVDYDTEVNSVKAILLLDFIEDLRLVNQTIRERRQAGEKFYLSRRPDRGSVIGNHN